MNVFFLYLVVSLHLEVKISTLSCVMYFTHFPPLPPSHVLYSFAYISRAPDPPCCRPLCTHTPSTSTALLPLPIGQVQIKFINTRCILGSILSSFRSHFRWSAPCCTYSMFICLFLWSGGVDIVFAFAPAILVIMVLCTRLFLPLFGTPSRCI